VAGSESGLAGSNEATRKGTVLRAPSLRTGVGARRSALTSRGSAVARISTTASPGCDQLSSGHTHAGRLDLVRAQPSVPDRFPTDLQPRSEEKSRLRGMGPANPNLVISDDTDRDSWRPDQQSRGAHGVAVNTHRRSHAPPSQPVVAATRGKPTGRI